MLANLTVKSNLIEGNSTQELARLSAMELYSIHRRLPNRTFYLDQRVRHLGGPLPTPRQNEEWTQRLFWHNDTISFEDNTLSTWANETLTDVETQWTEMELDLDVETAFEILALIALTGNNFSDLRAKVQQFLTLHSTDQRDSITLREQKARISQIIGRKVTWDSES